MSQIKDEAIVLRRLDYAENSQVLALFTRLHGKARIIAKGIKRSTKTRFAPALDLLDVGQVVLSMRAPRQEALAILTEWSQSRAYAGLRERLEWLYGAQYAAAMTADLTEDWDPHPALFDALAGLLDTLAMADATLGPLVDFQRALAEEIGSAPLLECCIGCGQAMPTPGAIHFTALEGGLLCRNCEPARTEKRGVPPAALAWLAGSGHDVAGAAAAFQLFDYHLAHLLGRPQPLGRTYLAVCPPELSAPDQVSPSATD